MIINRHNYEEFFILYIDNELGSEERGQVEQFVQNHPDLKEELEGLLHYKMTPDLDIVFPGKDELLKGVGQSAVNLANYKEWLLLYIDNELSLTERITVEQFLAGNDAAQKELALLERTKLQPETISYGDKRSLYRREERRIPVAWWRGAAAVIILALGVTAYLLTKGPGGSSKETANTNPAKEIKPAEKNIPVSPAKNTDNLVVNGQKDDPSVDAVVAEKEKQLLRPVAEKGKNNIAVNNPVATAKSKLPDPAIVPGQKEVEPAVVITKDKPSNNLPQPLNNPNLSPNPAKDALADNPVKDPVDNRSKTTLTEPRVTSNQGQPSDLVVNASYKPAADGFDQDAKDGKKNKLRGFFRKITRTFEKRTNIDPTTDDNKLLVAGLSINLK